MPHYQMTPFESALLRAVEELNTTFEIGLKSASGSPIEFESLRREFARFTSDLEKRLRDLEQQQDEMRRLLDIG